MVFRKVLDLINNLNKSRHAGEFSGWLRQASRDNIDINDWLEIKLGWKSSQPVVDMCSKYLDEKSLICEIGSGTGREARRLLKYIPNGELHCFEKGRGQVEFLKEYFSSQNNVFVHHTDGLTLGENDDCFDFVFSHGTFIYLKLGVIFRLAQDINRVLKPGGHCTLSYIDINSGWEYLKEQAYILPDCYEFYTEEIIERVFNEAGLVKINTSPFFSFTVISFRKQSPVSEGEEAGAVP